MKTTIKGIISALEILISYPGIEKIADIKKSQQFLKLLEKFGVSEIPEINSDIRNLAFNVADSFQTVINDWYEALRNLPILVNDPEDSSPEEKIKGKILNGLFARDWVDFNHEIEFHYRSYEFEFNSDNKAIIICNSDKTKNIEGTWQEIFTAIVKHCQEKLVCPEIPETEQ